MRFLESGCVSQSELTDESLMTTAKPPCRYGAIEGARVQAASLYPTFRGRSENYGRSDFRLSARSTTLRKTISESCTASCAAITPLLRADKRGSLPLAIKSGTSLRNSSPAATARTLNRFPDQPSYGHP